MAEMSGDLETAQDFYREAQTGDAASRRIGLATRPNVVGARLEAAASGNETDVSGAIHAAGDARQANPAPVLLKYRNGTPVVEPSPQLSSPSLDLGNLSSSDAPASAPALPQRQQPH